MSRSTTSSSNATVSAAGLSTVVELAEFRNSSRVRSASLPVQSPQMQSAQLLSIRSNLGYQASVEIDQFEWIKLEFGDAVRNKAVKDVRALLNKEFGKLRVYRYRRLFVIRHRSVEGIISSLLRVQFHAQQIELPTTNKAGDVVPAKPVTLTWGVGRTTVEAEIERLRRRKQKFKR